MFEIWRTLFSYNTRFEFRPSTLLPTKYSWKLPKIEE